MVWFVTPLGCFCKLGTGRIWLFGSILFTSSCFGKSVGTSREISAAGSGGGPMAGTQAASGGAAASTSVGGAVGLGTEGGGATAGTGVSEAGAAGAMPVEETTASGFPICGTLDPDRENDCDNIDLIEPLSPDVSSLTTGEIQSLDITGVFVFVHNGDEQQHDDVCVGVTVDTPHIELYTEHDETNPTPLGRLTPGNTVGVSPASMRVDDRFGYDATFTFWTTYVGTKCEGPTVSLVAHVISHF